MKKGILTVIVAAAIVFMFNTKALAESEQGAIEIGLSMALFSHNNGIVKVGDPEVEFGTKTSILMGESNITVGYFFTDALEAGLRLGDIDMGNLGTQSWPYLFLRYNLGSTVAPFIGLDFGYMSYTEQESVDGTDLPDDWKISGFLIGGEFGLKYFLSERSAINFEYDLIYTSGSTSDDPEPKATSFGGNLLFGFAFVY